MCNIDGGSATYSEYDNIYRGVRPVISIPKSNEVMTALGLITTSSSSKSTVSVQSEDTNKGTITSPSTAIGQYDSGATITLQASAASGYQFSGWYDGETLISTENPYTYTVNGSLTITAKFEEDTPDYSKLRNNSNIRHSNSKWNKLGKRMEIFL